MRYIRLGDHGSPLTKACVTLWAKSRDGTASRYHQSSILGGDSDEKHDRVMVRDPERLLRALRGFQVEQFVFSSTMLAHAATEPGGVIVEAQPIDPKLPYRASKIRTEALIHELRGSVPLISLRPAGVYDDLCSNTFLAHQIARIFERRIKGHLYSGDLGTDQLVLPTFHRTLRRLRFELR